MTNMYSRVLFAVEDDETLAAVVPVVAAYARRWEAYVRVLHVHPVDPNAPNGTGWRLVKAVIERLEADGVRAEGEIRPLDPGGKVAAAIASAARQARADLVAVGSHGRTDLGALLLGSVSHAVAAGVDVPVLVVRARAARPATPRVVLVPVDGSAGSDQAVAEAAELASAFGARVAVVHVQAMVAAEGAIAVEPEEQAQAVVRQAVATVAARGVQVTGEAVPGYSVVQALVDAAARTGADLVVLGSRRPSDLSGLLLGSVAHDVIHRLRCPVLLGRRVPATEPVA